MYLFALLDSASSKTQTPPPSPWHSFIIPNLSTCVPGPGPGN